MKKFLSFLLCLLLFSGCSQPAAEDSSTPIADATATHTEATTVPEITPTHSVASPTQTPFPTPMPTPILEGQTTSFENIFTYHFNSKNDAILKTPKDFAAEEELNEFIYQDCLRRHQELISFIKSNQLTELFLWVDFLGQDLLPELIEDQYFRVPCVLTDKELLNEWKDFVLNTSLKKNSGYTYSPETIPTGMGRSISYCANMGNKQRHTKTYVFRDNFRYDYPDPDHVTALYGYLPVTFADWDEETQKRYEEFENKIYQLAADKFKAAYEQAANYPFLN